MNTALNHICPYFTMYPLQFPYGVLSDSRATDNWVLDPFCGRGTTNFASRILGMPSVGIDSNPVAVAISRAKLVTTTPDDIVNAAEEILEQNVLPRNIPDGEFWDMAFHEEVLISLCRLREGLLDDCSSPAHIALRAIILGGLHGPKSKSGTSYFSNQSPRTFAPKPKYATRFWKEHGLQPDNVNVMEIIQKRAERYFGGLPHTSQELGFIVEGDSRQAESYRDIQHPVQWIITSPPYYGMTTYLPDQWLRLWFLGGKSEVEYSSHNQVSHRSPTQFANDLRMVWQNCERVSTETATLVVRFGGINQRKTDPEEIISLSFEGTNWHLDRMDDAGVASRGRRQASHFVSKDNLSDQRLEFDVWSSKRT